MKGRALEAAQDSLERAVASLEALRVASSVKELEAAWSDVLAHSQRVFSKLAAGAGGKSQAWWGKTARERKDDPLLSYAHQARHADEHGIERVSRTVKPINSITLNGDPKKSGLQKLPDIIAIDGEMVSFQKNDGVADITYGPEEIRLIPVVNKKVTFTVPDRHLGEEKRYVQPVQIADDLVAYMKVKVAEAEHLRDGE